MGAAFYDDEDCIDCGICSATTNEARKMKLVRPPEYIPDFAMGFDTEGLPIAPSIPKPKA